MCGVPHFGWIFANAGRQPLVDANDERQSPRRREPGPRLPQPTDVISSAIPIAIHGMPSFVATIVIELMNPCMF